MFQAFDSEDNKGLMEKVFNWGGWGLSNVDCMLLSFGDEELSDVSVVCSGWGET